METLNAIEKITLLVSTGIVCLANLFVLLERAKRSEKQNANNATQKLMTIKNTFFGLVLIIVMGSCSGSKFLNRKYTSGRFTEHKRSLTHNTIYVDTTKRYSSLNEQIELKKSPVAFSDHSDKEIMDLKVTSIIKKDSIFIINQKGRNKRVVKTNNLPDVKIFVKGDKKIIKTYKQVSPELVKIAKEKKIQKFSIFALSISLIPILGFAFSITAKRLIKKYKKLYPSDNIQGYSRLSNLAFALSILPAILGVAIVLVVIAIMVLFLMTGGGAAVVL